MNPFVFSSATMLLWGLAALAPILIHLWNRRRYRETDWAAMKFLLAAMKKNRRRIQVEQLLLLLVRCAILLFFAIALADISCSGGSGISGFGGPGSATHTVLVIDQSYSMAYGEEGQTRLDQAKELARRIINEAGEGDGFTLLTMGRTAKGIIAEPAFDPSDVLRELDQIEICVTKKSTKRAASPPQQQPTAHKPASAASRQPRPKQKLRREREQAQRLPV